MLEEYREIIRRKEIELNLLKKSERENKARLEKLTKEADLTSQARIIFQKASILTQNHLAKHLSTIVTKAIRAVIQDKNISFKVEFIERRNVTECDMWIEENDRRFSLLESRGYGITDIVSFALRVSYLLLHNSDNILVIDEPFRNLSEDNHEAASLMIKELAKELGIQFIISTHVPSLREHADVSFHIVQENGISKAY